MRIDRIARTTAAQLMLMLMMIPATIFAAEWNIDKSHSTIGFTIRHLGISKVHGGFSDFDGKIVFDEADLEGGSVEVTIRVSSIDTRDDGRDDHLRGADFFDVEKHPEIRFKGEHVTKEKDRFILHGNLTILGVEKHVAIPFEFLGSMEHPMFGTRAGFEGKVTITREDFGLGWSDVKYRPPLIGNDVEITLNLEAVKAK